MHVCICMFIHIYVHKYRSQTETRSKTVDVHQPARKQHQDPVDTHQGQQPRSRESWKNSHAACLRVLAGPRLSAAAAEPMDQNAGLACSEYLLNPILPLRCLCFYEELRQTSVDVLCWPAYLPTTCNVDMDLYGVRIREHLLVLLLRVRRRSS